MEKLLNKLLADLSVEYHKLQSLHWYMSGYHFFDDHEQMQKYYEMVAEMVDGTAEAMLTLEMKPESSMKGWLAITEIKERANEDVTSEEAYTEVLKDFTILRDDVLAVKKEADATEDYQSSQLMDGYIADLYKALWMVRQVLKK